MKLNRLKELREEHGYSMQQFATYIGLATTTYKDKESGKRKFKVEELENIINFLNINPLELLDIKEKE
ncbi:TPA: helix-turn-helix transcriptional regulator [Clostridioides difficile]|nr:helix-turn-helix domain-containing protein [Clostridioides difficile]HBF2805574.1 helix-turn-helix transcriptional regulator [Clostridioides difficile]HBF3756540.1 helix-turn-helix transcriptional regulator [Clostridioides difficile]HBF6247061.1 helix-turn-helix transcriptional regulator [Clostridioides difficile]HBY3218630.1 helix-turn-helix transcriptional regulator [Clostridioides difficile]